MVKYNNRWGTVCDDGILPTSGDGSKSVRAAQSACHTLGLSGGVIETYSSGMSDPIWMDNVDCATSTTNFLTCNYDHDTSDCGHDEDVLLTCT